MEQQPVNDLSKQQKIYPKEDWVYEVNNNDTELGYKEWVKHCIERDK